LSPASPPSLPARQRLSPSPRTSATTPPPKPSRWPRTFQPLICSKAWRRERSGLLISRSRTPRAKATSTYWKLCSLAWSTSRPGSTTQGLARRWTSLKPSRLATSPLLGRLASPGAKVITLFFLVTDTATEIKWSVCSYQFLAAGLWFVVMSELVKSDGAMLRSFYQTALLARGFNKDNTVWLGGAIRPPKYIWKKLYEAYKLKNSTNSDPMLFVFKARSLPLLQGHCSTL